MNEPQAEPGPAGPPSPAVLDRALSLVEFLRARCPWDAAQTPESLRRYLLEEAHEVVDAIDSGDDGALADELGDLLLNLAFQVVIAEERRSFGRTAVVEGLEAKMRRRHPHIYGDGEPSTWEALKAAERNGDDGRPEGLLESVIPGPDPLAHAYRLQARAATVGFDWPDPSGAYEKVREEIAEVGAEVAAGDSRRLEEELGDLLFAVVNLARLAKVHPTTALVRANRKFTRRFGRLEGLAAERGIDPADAGLETLDRLWEDVKREER